MGSRGSIIMSFFGAVFVSLTLMWQRHVWGPVLILPFLIFAAIGSAALYVLRRSGGGNALSDGAKRTLIWASTGEGIGIFIAINIVMNLHRPEWRLPAMALVVGLHFLPIAYGAAFRAFYILGAALIVAALIGFAAPPPLGGYLAGIAAAMCLWTASLAGVLRDWRMIPPEKLAV
ncbi:MAG: hypothetical protein EOO77_05215 [Oxalobacteraceae bacterium]|nr:MAG: hypothetical protein EOO77_05215 [Oxalobacteraceae bacterium]